MANNDATHLFTSHASKGQFEMARSKANDNYFKTKLTKYCTVLLHLSPYDIRPKNSRCYNSRKFTGKMCCIENVNKVI